MEKSKSKSIRNYDLSDRLIAYNILVGSLCDLLIVTKESMIIKNQLTRAVSSAALNYGEVLVAESRADFIHKISICLKELMESKMAIRIIEGRKLCQDEILVKKCLKESSELVAIFISSVNTARKKG